MQAFHILGLNSSKARYLPCRSWNMRKASRNWPSFSTIILSMFSANAASVQEPCPPLHARKNAWIAACSSGSISVSAL